MVAANLTSYLNSKDKHDVPVSSWAVAYQPGIAKCKHCQCDVSFKEGARGLTKHSETKKHRKKSPKQDTVQHQQSIEEALSSSQKADEKKEEILDKTTEFEVGLARSLSFHKIPAEFLDCLQQHLKKYCSDSAVISKMVLHKTKGRYIVRHGIGPTYMKETVELLRKCDGFSVGFDESEINKTSELEMLVKVATKEGSIQLRHYRTLDLYAGTAAKIVETLLGQFTSDGIDYKKKLFTAMTDGCNTMQGWKGGVKKLLGEQIPQFKDMGSCNDHHICNAMKHGVSNFDSDLQPGLVNIYFDLGGAKGKGLKKKKDFEAACKLIGLVPDAYKKFCETRFRGIRNCLLPVVCNWEGMIEYYSSLKKPTERQQFVKSYFVEREMMTKLNIYFVQAALRELMEAIDYFEKRTYLLHQARGKMEQLLRSMIMKFHCETAVKEADDEGTIISNKTGEQLLEVDLDDATTLLTKKKVFIGEKALDFIKALDLNPKSPQLEKFFTNVYSFHKTVTSLLIKYFTTALKSTEL